MIIVKIFHEACFIIKLENRRMWMRRLFGRVVVEHGKCILKYYLTGSRKEGYSITILQEKENETLCSKCEQITRSTIDAKRLCYKLVRGIVFPEQLEEIVRDQI